MAIELSNIIFTDQDDFVPLFGEEQIVNTGIANTLAGDDVITGTVTQDSGTGISNDGTLNTGDGNDIINGNGAGINSGIGNSGYIDTGDDNDVITGINNGGDGDGITNYGGGTIDTGNGNDIITGIATFNSPSSKGIYNSATINTGNGNDSIISQGNSVNYGGVFLGNGNDSIIVDTDLYYAILSNLNIIEAGDGNDIINTNVIYNEGVINTGNGDDSIIADGGFPGLYGIYNNGGNINTGDGNDIIIANEGFESGPNSSGAWFLGEGEDYIKGFGSGDFYGGNGLDILELTPGSYTVGIWGEGGESPIFTKGNQLMITSEFEILLAGGTVYDFASLTAGQIIIVA
jgi:hypothetical protein